MRVLTLLYHSIEEYDQVRLLSGLGHDVFSIGAYMDPHHPSDDMRPAVPEAADHPELRAIVNAVKPTLEMPDHQRVAKRHLPDELIEWAEVIICHHLEGETLWAQWPRIRHKRVIWRTVGQSLHVNEWQAKPYFSDGLEIVRYSPKERNIPNYAGESALIRFYKDENEYKGWNGTSGHVLALHQNPTKRGEGGSWVNLDWLQRATEGLPVRWVGPGTEVLGGAGKVSPSALIYEMRQARCAIYTGTQPASYTLALIEQMMTGLPVVSIGAAQMQISPYGSQLFEGHEIAPLAYDSADDARAALSGLLSDRQEAAAIARKSRARAIALFSRERAEKAWQGWLEHHTQPDPDPEGI